MRSARVTRAVKAGAGLLLLTCAVSGQSLPMRAPEAASTQVLAASVRPAAPVGPSSAARTSTARPTTARPTTARWARAVDVRSHDAVNAAYARDYAPGLDTPTGWTGDDSGCRTGSSSTTSRAATLRAVNFVRSLGGLAPVTFDATLNARSQQTALIMSANQSLSHTPPRSWRCWTRTGSDNAGRSNLALSYPSITSAGLVGLYMGEPGASNQAVGHRRWLMNPFATSMGSGSTSTANAMTVIGPQSSSRPNPAWVSWPTAGWFPAPLEPDGRWSLSAGNTSTSFASATVRVYREGQPVRVVRQPVENGYAMPTLVWQLPAATPDSGLFRVEVSGIRTAGSSQRTTKAYSVRLFTPAP